MKFLAIVLVTHFLGSVSFAMPPSNDDVMSLRQDALFDSLRAEVRSRQGSSLLLRQIPSEELSAQVSAACVAGQTARARVIRVTLVKSKKAAEQFFYTNANTDQLVPCYRETLP